MREASSIHDLLLSDEVKRKNTAGTLQVERMFILTRKPLAIEDKKRLHYNGTSNGEHMFAGWRAHDNPSLWTMKRKDKKNIITKKEISLMGGAGEDKQEDKDLDKLDALSQTPETIEPVFWHAPPNQLQDEWVHCFNLKTIVDLTPGDGSRAMTAIRYKVPWSSLEFPWRFPALAPVVPRTMGTISSSSSSSSSASA